MITELVVWTATKSGINFRLYSVLSFSQAISSKMFSTLIAIPLICLQVPHEQKTNDFHLIYSELCLFEIACGSSCRSLQILIFQSIENMYVEYLMCKQFILKISLFSPRLNQFKNELVDSQLLIRGTAY